MIYSNLKYRQRIDYSGKYRYWGILSPTSSKSDFTLPENNFGNIGDSEQWTGLCDKKGTEIYVGDILQHWLDSKEFHTGVVIFENGAFIVKDSWTDLIDSEGCGSSVWQNLELYTKDCFVIGNIGDIFFRKVAKKKKK